MAKDFVNDDVITPEFATKWDKAAETVATKTTKGLMSATDKTKLDGVEAEANNYKHPATHLPAIMIQDPDNRFVTDVEKALWSGKASTAVVTTSRSGLMSSADKTKLDGVATGANNYTHPATHPPTVIAQNASHRFVTDTEKSVWNGKLNGNGNAVSATKLLTGRTIAGVRFDGTANITISASNVGAYTRAETNNRLTSEMSGNVIFDGAAYMNERQEFFYDFNKMKIGLFITWSAYKPGVGPENSHFSTQIILKEQIRSWPGNSTVLHLGVVNARMRRKMLYANRARVIGHVDNGSGDNRDFAARKILVI